MKTLKQKMYRISAASIENHLEGNGDDKLRTVSALHEIPEGVRDLFSNTAGLTEFLELRFNVGSASDYLKNSFAFIETTSFNQTAEFADVVLGLSALIAWNLPCSFSISAS